MMFPVKLRTEREMMLEVALVADREGRSFKPGHFLYHVNGLLYRSEYLDVLFIHTHCHHRIIALQNAEDTNAPWYYCLFSELYAAGVKPLSPNQQDY
ncbi:hypothetical protein HPC38_07530 [Pasteurellaceae bacterium HPA106]|uniref:hypothetical protein n=1 Tax=Spirabiliibacterium pneumoniae TaxID=221400 RepID=UPI001AADA9C5|nr:hypothetical protein [Spirabiliibacterium pneumoniae]MBE2896722.1 hypothetical protein [Spirabiliibacterium pneumoniae]